MLKRYGLEELNFNDEFSELVLGVSGIGPQIWLDLKMLMDLFLMTNKSLIVHGVNYPRDTQNICTGCS